MHLNDSALSLANFDTVKAQESAPIELGRQSIHDMMQSMSPDKKDKKMKKTKENMKNEAKPPTAARLEDDLPADQVEAQQRAWDRLVAKNNNADDLISVEQALHGDYQKGFDSNQKLIAERRTSQIKPRTVAKAKDMANQGYNLLNK